MKEIIPNNLSNFVFKMLNVFIAVDYEIFIIDLPLFST